jgi:hypothetical protein
VARRDIIVSDFTGRSVDPTELVTVTVRYADARRGIVVADAAPSDEIIASIVKAGRKQRKRGRRPARLEEELTTAAGTTARRGRRVAA